MPIKKIVNYAKSVPTRLKAKAEYQRNMYDRVRVGSDLYKIPKKNPIKYNLASTGIKKGKNK